MDNKAVLQTSLSCEITKQYHRLMHAYAEHMAAKLPDIAGMSGPYFAESINHTSAQPAIAYIKGDRGATPQEPMPGSKVVYRASSKECQ